MNNKIFDLAVIGGGPGGMVAAICAAEKGAKVVLIEKNNRLGLKLLITGKGRCNITNAETEIRKFIKPFGKNGKFLMNSLYRFGVKEAVEFFNRNGLATKVERGGRIFPESDKASDVLQLFTDLLKKKNVAVYTECYINDFVVTNSSIEKIVTDAGDIKALNYIIATGGLSYPKTGSTGTGYTWAKKLGHTIVKPKPALTPIIAKENWIGELEGLSLKNVSVSVFQKNKKYDERFGEALFTGNGISGPIVLDLSKTVGELLETGNVLLFIDFKPALDHEKLDKRLLRDLDKLGKKSMKNILGELLPKKLIPVMLRRTDIDPEKLGNTLSKEERKRLRMHLKQFSLTADRLVGFSKAIITSGGVSLKEVNPKTMCSKIINNLYFAGEILDLDGPTGGYNLQVCWSTGFAAGSSIVDKCGL